MRSSCYLDKCYQYLTKSKNENIRLYGTQHEQCNNTCGRFRVAPVITILFSLACVFVCSGFFGSCVSPPHNIVQ